MKILGKIVLGMAAAVLLYFAAYFVLKPTGHGGAWKSTFFIPAQMTESSLRFISSSRRYNGVWVTKDPTATFVTIETRFDLYRCTLTETDATGKSTTTLFKDQRNPVYGNDNIILTDGDRYLMVPRDGSPTLRLDVSTGPWTSFTDATGRKQYSRPQHAIHLVPKV